MGPALLILCVAGAASFLVCDFFLSALPENASEEAVDRGTGVAIVTAIVVFFAVALALGYASIRVEEMARDIHLGLLSKLTDHD